jgi:hypothetical protein
MLAGRGIDDAFDLPRGVDRIAAQQIDRGGKGGLGVGSGELVGHCLILPTTI